MAPILSFTAEEAWAVFASAGSLCRTATRPSSPRPSGPAAGRSTTRAALLDKYAALREVRADVTKELEEVRVSGAIGSSLQAEVDDPGASGERYALLASLGDDLKFVLITSQASVAEAAAGERSDRTVTPSRRREVRTLLALPRATSAPTRAPGHLRALRQQPVTARAKRAATPEHCATALAPAVRLRVLHNP